jgi:hypothetical protein
MPRCGLMRHERRSRCAICEFTSVLNECVLMEIGQRITFDGFGQVGEAKNNAGNDCILRRLARSKWSQECLSFRLVTHVHIVV